MGTERLPCFVFSREKELLYPPHWPLEEAVKGLPEELVAPVGANSRCISIPLNGFSGPPPFIEKGSSPPAISLDQYPVTVKCFMVDSLDLVDEIKGWHRLPVRTILAELVSQEEGAVIGSSSLPLCEVPLAGEREGLFTPSELLFLRVPRSVFLRIFHLMQWVEHSTYCGHCGALTTWASDEVARLCPACGRREYPRISPAVMVAVRDSKNRLLLAHNARFRPGVYSVIAGFVEAGEALEQAVYREVWEETGIEVGHIRYVASQSWPFPDSLMIGFTARATSDCITVDGREILDARFYGPEELPELPLPGSLSRILIDRWQRGLLP